MNLNERITDPVFDDILTGGSKDLSILENPSIPSKLPSPLIPVPASKVYKKLENNRIETFLRKLNQRLENIVKKEN